MRGEGQVRAEPPAWRKLTFVYHFWKQPQGRTLLEVVNVVCGACVASFGLRFTFGRRLLIIRELFCFQKHVSCHVSRIRARELHHAAIVWAQTQTISHRERQTPPVIPLLTPYPREKTECLPRLSWYVFMRVQEECANRCSPRQGTADRDSKSYQWTKTIPRSRWRSWHGAGHQN
jgi:hypothetical protein